MSDPTEYKLQFDGGPAAGDTVFMFVPPSHVRWYVEMETPEGRRHWWVYDREPEPDPALTVTRYEQRSSEVGGEGRQIVIYESK